MRIMRCGCQYIQRGLITPAWEASSAASYSLFWRFNTPTKKRAQVFDQFKTRRDVQGLEYTIYQLDLLVKDA